MDIFSQYQNKSVPQETQKALTVSDFIQMRMQDTTRPLSDTDMVNNSRTGAVTQFGLNTNLHTLFVLSRYSDILQLIFKSRRTEIFRNGFEIEPENAIADKDELRKIEQFIQKCNSNGQSFKEVLGEFQTNMDWADDGYIALLKEYGIAKNGDISSGIPKEAIAVSPLDCEMVLDSMKRLGYQDSGTGTQAYPVYFSVYDRSCLTIQPRDEKTGVQNIQAHYKVRTGKGYTYYNSSEIFHRSIFNPSITYGFSPLFSIYNKVISLIAQDYYIRKNYAEDRPLKGLLVFNTDNADSLWKMWDDLKKRKQQNPQAFHPIPFMNKDGRKAVEYIDMSRPLDEMQFIEQRKEYRSSIGALYGVSPVFQNDVSTSGGLNNEGLQITVTNRTIEDMQAIYNDEVFPWLFSQFGVLGWSIRLKPSEEQDLMKDKQLRAQELQNVKAILELGIQGRMDEHGQFVFMPGELALQQNNILTEGIDSTTEQDTDIGQSGSPFQKGDELGAPVEPKIDIHKKQDKTTISPQKVQEFQTALEKELDKILKQLDFRAQRPSEVELEQTVERVVRNLDKRLKAKSANIVRGIYNKSMADMQKELKQKLTLTDKDRNVIEALKRDPTYQKAFSSMTEDMTKQITDIIKQAYDSPDTFTIDNIVKNIQETVSAKESRLRLIARTETGKISAAARKTSYEKTTDDFNTLLFKWIGPEDRRTTKVSKRIKNRTKNGVDWNTLVSIIREESAKDFPQWEVNELAPISHYQSRHTFVRKI